MLIDCLNLETYILAGQSVGGTLAGELALTSPTRVKGPIMMGTYLGQEPTEPQAYFMRLPDRVEASGTFTPVLLDEITAMFFLRALWNVDITRASAAIGHACGQAIYITRQ